MVMDARVFVGTSGWIYDWNLGGSLDWYIQNSGLNAIELNSSFYRFPYPSQVVSWARRGGSLSWSIKVHRSITHLRKLSDKTIDTWLRFYKLFQPLDEHVDFYLFQMPPNFSASEENISRVKGFFAESGLGRRLAIEFRHESWFSRKLAETISDMGATYVSVDSPMGTFLHSSGGVIYLRMHGRSNWYSHDYSIEELSEIADIIFALEPARIYVFFNNDHWMLENARVMLGLLSQGRG